MQNCDEYHWPAVTVCICTYDRPFECKAVLSALHHKLTYPNLRWHIADDGSSKKVINEIAEHCDELGIDAVVTSTARKGWGANVNFALETIVTDLVYFTEDDYVLLKPLDLRPFAALLDTYESVGLIRFGISGHDGIVATLREFDIPDDIIAGYSEACGLGSTAAGKVNAWELDLRHRSNWGPFGFFRYSNRPHLKHRRFHEQYGKYSEGLPLATTEEEFNHRITKQNSKGNKSWPSIIVPCSWTYWNYDHIGVSRQGTEEDVHE